MTESNNSTLRIALAGGGKMAVHHARSIARLAPGARLVALADPAPEAAAAIRAVEPSLAVYPDLEALLAAGSVDVVHIVTPPATHVPLALKAIEAGAHVYVEKPVAPTADEARTLLEAAQRHHRLVCAGHQLLFEPPSRVVAGLRPALGRLVHVESYFSFRTVRRTPGGRAPLRADLQLLDILPHPVYLLLRSLEDEPGETELVSLSVSASGTVHALVRRGGITGTLIVTLEGRPIESYLRLVGTNGSVTADFVRSTVQRHLGPGISGIDKVFAPYRTARQLAFGTTGALARRILNRQRSYPGLVELFDAFYQAVRTGGPSPVPPTNIEGTTRICEAVAAALTAEQERLRLRPRPSPSGPLVVVTGGTGFLGRATVRALLAANHRVRVLARRAPAAWEEELGADYRVADAGGGIDPELVRGADLIIHAAAETAGGWEDHQRNSVGATRHVLEAARDAGVRRVIHVSSVAVLASGGTITDRTPLEPNRKGSGPYVWGKLESEELAGRLAAKYGIDLRIVRPGAIVDSRDFDPPGRLGKRLGNIFVAVGAPGHRLGVVELELAANTLAWMAGHFDEAPTPVNLLDPDLPTKRELLRRLRAQNPDISVLWLPTLVLHPLSWAAWVMQKVLRPGRPPINVAKVFSVPAVDTGGMRDLARRMNGAS